MSENPIYGYSAERPTAFFTHIFNFDEKIIADMERDSCRYDNRAESDYASFIHLTKEDRDRFIEKFDIILVKHKNELKAIKKMINGA